MISKKKILQKGGLLATFLVLSIIGFGQEKPQPQVSTSPYSTGTIDNSKINWMTWDEMVKAQETERRKVFIDVYTDWCGWCKKMDASTFLEPNIVNYMNQGYYAVKLDAEMKEPLEFNGFQFVNPNPTGRRSTHQFAASMLDGQLSYPSFVILDENFTRQHIIKGFQQPEPLLGTLIFFKTNEFVRYNQYLQKQDQLQKQREQAAQQNQKVDTP